MIKLINFKLNLEYRYEKTLVIDPETHEEIGSNSKDKEKCTDGEIVLRGLLGPSIALLALAQHFYKFPAFSNYVVPQFLFWVALLIGIVKCLNNVINTSDFSVISDYTQLLG